MGDNKTFFEKIAESAEGAMDYVLPDDFQIPYPHKVFGIPYDTGLTHNEYDTGPTFKVDRDYAENFNKKTPGQKGIWHGLSAGYDAWSKPDYDSNLNKGQRSEAEQEAWNKYNRYKHYAGEALKRGEITEEQFNHIKGKAGANTVMNYYVDKEESPFFYGLANNAANMMYQFNQSWDGDQPWSEAIKDYWQQDNGAEDKNPLLKPWQEIKYWQDKGPLSN